VDLEFGETVGDHRRSDPVECEDARVTVLDDDRRPGPGGELGQGVAQRAPDQARHQVDEGFRCTDATGDPSMRTPQSP